jgi:hypothetical protein
MQTLAQRAQAGLSSAAHTWRAPAACRRFSSGTPHFNRLNGSGLNNCHTTLGSFSNDSHTGVASHRSSSLLRTSSRHEPSMRCFTSTCLDMQAVQLEDGGAAGPATNRKTSVKLNAETLVLSQLRYVLQVGVAVVLLFDAM